MRIDRVNVMIASQIERLGFVPEGWKLLGRGSSRTAYLGPDGMVYKISNFGDTYQQAAEGRAVWAWRKRNLPEGFVIPRAHYCQDENVLVMEYHEGTQPRCSGWDGCKCGLSECWTIKLRDFSRKTGLCDVQTANSVLRPDGVIVIIDLGCEDRF